MTEPVAWRVKNKGGMDWQLLPFTPRGHYDVIEPLYTDEQLHPRVKMTQAEFDEFVDLYGNTEGGNGNVYFGLDKAINLESFYPNLNRRLISDNKSNSNFYQVEFANLWIRFDSENLEETIEIVPDMKWFVRSKEQYQPDMDQGISESGYLYLTQGNIYSIEYYDMTTFKDEAQQFDTKDEAERWTNPLTEAVQLPVEDE